MVQGVDAVITFVIPYRAHPDRAGRLERLTALLATQLHAGMEIIVSDQSGAFNEAVCDLVTTYILEPRGSYNPARARNLAIGMARNEWVCSLDVDVIPPADFCEQLEASLPAGLMTYCTFEVLEGDRPHFDPPTYWGSAAFLYSQALWCVAGGYCEDYEGYGYEDPDFCDRCMSAGAAHTPLPITVQHDPHPQVEGINQDIERNRAIYERRH